MSEVFGVVVSRDEEEIRVSVHGQFIVTNRQTVRHCVLELLKEKPKRIVIDFDQCSYIDAAGLGVLVSLLRTVEDEGVALLIGAYTDDIRDLLKITKLDGVFEFARSHHDRKSA